MTLSHPAVQKRDLFFGRHLVEQLAGGDPPAARLRHRVKGLFLVVAMDKEGWRYYAQSRVALQEIHRVTLREFIEDR
jgi:hypothetical protein